MKTSKKSYANLICICSFCVGISMFSCEKADFTPAKSIRTVARLKQSPTFSFTLMTSHCIAGGVGVTVDIENPSEYTFLWEVNGNHGGHDISTLPCLCGGTATVHVTRLADGVSMSKSIVLPVCKDDKAFLK